MTSKKKELEVLVPQELANMTPEKELLKKYPCIKGIYYYSRSTWLKVWFKNDLIKIFTEEEELEKYIKEHQKELNAYSEGEKL